MNVKNLEIASFNSDKGKIINLSSVYSSRGKNIMLTFDDGPSSTYTGQVLDLLNNLNIKATFFTIGSFALENADLIGRMADEGHTVGLHSYSHKSAYLMTSSQIQRDMDMSVEVLKDLGINPRFYRPPWGHTKKSLLCAAGYHHLIPIYWNVMAQDWKANISVDEIASRLINRTSSGSIVCLHDGRGKNNAPQRTIDALKIVLPIWIYHGYRFVTADEVFAPERA